MKRGRPQSRSNDGEKPNGEKNHFVCYKCNILGTLQGIVEHLIVKMELIKEGMPLYVSYVITLDTQQDYVEWIEGTLIGTLITKGTIIGML